MARGISCSLACGIFPDQGLNLCLQLWQADSLPPSHHGSALTIFTRYFSCFDKTHWQICKSNSKFFKRTHKSVFMNVYPSPPYTMPQGSSGTILHIHRGIIVPGHFTFVTWGSSFLYKSPYFFMHFFNVIHLPFYKKRLWIYDNFFLFFNADDISILKIFFQLYGRTDKTTIYWKHSREYFNILYTLWRDSHQVN